MASPDAASYYRGRTAQLHAACQRIGRGSEPVAVLVDGARYVAAFTGRRYSTYPSEPPAPWLLLERSKGLLGAPGYRELYRNDGFIVLRLLEHEEEAP